MRLDDCFHWRGCYPLCLLTGRMDCASSLIKMLAAVWAEEKQFHIKKYTEAKGMWQEDTPSVFGDALLIKHTRKEHPIQSLLWNWLDKQQYRALLGYPTNLCGCGGMRCDICVMKTKCGVSWTIPLWSEIGDADVWDSLICREMTHRRRKVSSLRPLSESVFHLFAVCLRGERGQRGTLQVPITINNHYIGFHSKVNVDSTV